MPAAPIRGGYTELVGRHDHLLFWSLQPHFEDETGRIRINSQGLRGPEIPARALDELRILSLGESTTFAGRLPYAATYSARIEHGLNNFVTAQRARVINAGVPGYSLFQGYQFLKHRGVELAPDYVLLYFGYNDFLPIAFLADRTGADQREEGLNDWELFERRQTFVGRVSALLMLHSNLMRAVVTRKARRVMGPEARVQVDPDRPRVPEQHRLALLERTTNLCQSRNIGLVIVIPWYLGFEAHVPLLREFARQHRVPVVDLPAILSEERLSQPRESYFVDTVHPNAQGHALIADAIQTVIAEILATRPLNTIEISSHDQVDH